MKKKLMIAGIFTMLLVVCVTKYERGTKVLQTGDKIRSAEIRLLPPDKKIEVVDLAEFNGYVAGLKLYRKVSNYNPDNYAGQVIICQIEYENGKKVELKICSGDHVIISGIAYKANHDCIEVFNKYANELSKR